MPETIPLGNWEPDKSDRANPATEAKGCISQAGQYAPFPDILSYGAESTNDGFAKVLLHFDGADASTTITDSNLGGSAHTWTAAGNAQIDTAQSNFGGASGLFDGTGDFVSTPDHADFTLGSGDFTIDGWFNCNAPGGAFRVICGKTITGSTGANADRSFNVLRNTSNVISASVYVGSTAFTVAGTTQFTDALNTGWHHVAFVRFGNILRLFIDGVQEGGDVAVTGSVNDTNGPLSVGRSGDENFGVDWLGWIDEFRLSVGVARWTANFTPPTSAYGLGGTTNDVCVGARAVYDSDTVPHIFMGDAAALYELQSRVATDVSQAGGYTLGAEDGWELAQFGDNVAAVARSEQPQFRLMEIAPSAFADIVEAPANATSIARVGDFLWMGEGFTVHWSAFNNMQEWTPDPGTQAGNQELDQEQGEIMTLLGLDYAAIFQERAIRRAIYVGPPVIFDFGQDYVEKARGCISRKAAAPFGRIIFYAADDGFHAFDGQGSLQIGQGKVDHYFTTRLNYAYRHKVCVGIDGQRKLVVFGFPTGSSQLISELLIYSIQDQRWTHDEIDLELLFDMPSEPQTIDQAGGFWDQSIDAEPVASFNIDSGVLDDRRRRLAGVQALTHRLGLFTGGARAATLDTREFEPAPGQRGRVSEIWPMGDMQAGAVSAAVGYRSALPGGDLIFTNPTQMNRAGFCPQRVDARFMRGRLLLAAGASWRRMEGLHATSTLTGKR